MQGPTQFANGDYRDLFISHASEDKENFVRPLANALIAEGVDVWFDEFELQIGDSLRQKIDEGLRRSRYGLVVFSPTFFEKHWTQYEMDGLVARQMSGERVILPIWHQITRDEMMEHAPSLVDIVSLDSSKQSIDEMVNDIAKKVAIQQSGIPNTQPNTTTAQNTGSGFAVFYIAAAHTPELSSSERPPQHFMGFTSGTDWVSLVHGDEELEYRIEEQFLRVRLDRGNVWENDDLIAEQLLSGSQPFALTIRHTDGSQFYYPDVTNTRPNPLGIKPNPSGWMLLNVR